MIPQKAPYFYDKVSRNVEGDFFFPLLIYERSPVREALDALGIKYDEEHRPSTTVEPAKYMPRLVSISKHRTG